MIGLFRFSPSRLALVYVALGALVLGLFAIPLWYVWRVNYSTLRTYIDAEDVRTMMTRNSSQERSQRREHDHDEGRPANLLQGLGHGAARRCLQSWLAIERRRLGRPDALP